MASKLQIWNDALTLLGEPRLTTLTDDVQGRYELDNLYDRAVIEVTRQAAWHHAIKIDSPTPGATTYLGFSNSYPKPADWLRHHSIYTNIGTRESPIDARDIGSNYAVNSSVNVWIRYIYLATNETLWPESFVLALATYLAFVLAERISGKSEKTESIYQLWQARLAEGAAIDAMPDSEWLPFQLDGSMVRAARAIAEDGLWNFAEKRVAITPTTSTVSGYGYRYQKPADWLRTIDLYEPNGPSERFDVPWTDDGGYLHTNSASGVLRYVSTTNIEDASKWPEQFSELVLAYCQLHRLMNSPSASGASLQARQAVYEGLLREAKAKDSSRSRIRVNNRGVIIRSRYGGFYGEQGRRY